MRFIFSTWDISLTILILIIGVGYTEDLTTALKVMETNFSLLAIPLVVKRLGEIKRAKLYTFFDVFSLGVVVAALVCVISALINYLKSGDTGSFHYYQLTEIINSHPTYFAYYLIFTITYLLYLFYYGTNSFSSLLVVLSILFLFVVLILTGGRTASVSILFIFAFFVLKYLLENRIPRKTLGFIMIFGMLISLFAVSKYEDENYESSENDYWERSLLWESAIQANPNPIFGVGTGDYKNELNEYYNLHGMSEFALGSYNSHNQYVQRYFSNGLMGIFALLILLTRPVLLSVQMQNALGILIFFPFLIYGVTEVFFGRYQGVVFFTLLHQVLVFHYYDLRKNSGTQMQFE